MPQFVFSTQVRPIPRAQIQLVRAACQRACHLNQRGHSTYLIHALLRKGHRSDPEAAAMYAHILSVADALRTSQKALPLWDALIGLPPQKPSRGPCSTLKIYLERLGVVLQEDGQVITHLRTGSCRWLCCPLEEFRHFLRSLLRQFHLSRAVKSRPVLEGIEGLDIKRTAAVYRAGTFPLRAELAAILTDGIWTQTRKHQARLVDSGVCRACSLGVPETPEHIWQQCPAWVEWRTCPPRVWQAWNGLPTYSKRCLICPLDCDDDIRKCWSDLQKQSALILQKRNSRGVREGWVGNWRTPPEKDESHAETSTVPQDLQTSRMADPPSESQEEARALCPEIVSKRARHLDFVCTYRNHGRRLPWQYSRAQWHRLLRFASRIRIADDRGGDGSVVRPTTLELYLSYLASNGLVRFASQLDSTQNGHHIAVQLSSFVQAWRSFQSICDAEELVPNSKVIRDRWGEKADWGPHSLLPKFALLALPAILPKWRIVGEMLRDAARLIAERATGDESGRGGLWRFWTPGLADSQLSSDLGALSPLPLNSHPDLRVRIRDKSTLTRWQIQQHDFMAFPLLELPVLDQHFAALGTVSLREWLSSFGVGGVGDLRIACTVWRNAAKLARRAMKHNLTAKTRGVHLISSVRGERWQCASCQKRGFLLISCRWWGYSCSRVCSDEQITLAEACLTREFNEAHDVLSALQRLT